MANKVADIVTARIIEQLEQGVAPWRKPWQTAGRQWAANLISKKPYNGINQMLLQMSGFTSPFWLTYKQAGDLGGNVRKGEKGTPVIFVGVAQDKKKAAKGEKDGSYTFLRYYTVFNVDQCDGLSAHIPAPVAVANNPNAKIESAEAIAAGYQDGPTITKADAAWYRPSTDIVGIPDLAAFDSADSYYSTLFHELAHSTGHVSRLDREGVNGKQASGFGSELYGKEELIAELAAAFMCAESGIDNLPATASYCKSWIAVLKGDSGLIVSAAAKAQKAYERVIGAREVEQEAAA